MIAAFRLHRSVGSPTRVLPPVALRRHPNFDVGDSSSYDDRMNQLVSSMRTFGSEHKTTLDPDRDLHGAWLCNEALLECERGKWVMTFRFIHAADLHLDTPFDGLTASHPELAARLREASLDALDALVAAAIAQSVAFVVIAGDIYDGTQRGVRAQLRLLDATKRLAAAGIRTFISHGNHDPVDEGWSAIPTWPDEVHVFSSDKADVVAFQVDGEPVTVYGTSYATREVRTSLVPRFARMERQGHHIAVLHANVGNVTGHAAYSPCTVDELAAVGMDYWALGHVHRAAVLREANPRVVYPGNLQGRSFKPAEQGSKGASLVTVSDGGIRNVHLDLAPVRFEEVQVDLSQVDDIPTLVGVLENRAAQLSDETRTLIVRARLTGASDLWEDLAVAERGQDLVDDLRSRAPSNLWWSELINEARPGIDLASYRGREDLRGELVAVADRLRESPNEVRRLLTTEVALQGWLKAVDAERLSALIERAALEALLRLTREGSD